MVDVVIPGPLSGRRYGFRIAGEQPTADEQRRIDGLIRQREAQFGQEYQARFGEALPGAEGSGLLDYLNEIPKGVLRGVTGLGERGLLGAATLLPERFEAPTREGILGASRYLQSGLQPDIGFVGNRTAEGIARLSEGLGSTAPFFALAPLGFAGIAAGAAIGGGAGAGEASERARTGDATEAQRAQASLGGLGVGLSEVAVPVALRGLFGSLLRAGVPRTTIMARLGRIGTAATTEGAQEAATEFLQNAIEQGIYNPEKDLQEGLLPAAGTGAGVGAIIQGLIELGTRNRGPAAPAAPPATPPILALPSPSAFPSPPLPPVISVPPGPGQVSGSVGSNVPGARAAPAAAPATPPAAAASRAPATPPAAAASRAPTARPPSDEFDVEATVNALRDADGDYIPAMRALNITYPELQQRVRHLVSIERVRNDSAGRMFFDEPTAPTAPATPATPAAAPADYIAILDQLGVPRTAAVRKAVTSGTIATDEAFRARLATAAPVNAYLNAATPTATPQEITDAETAPRGPVGLDVASDRVGTARGITEPAAQPVAGDAGPGAADAPVGGAVGEPLLGAREAIVAEGDQPAALTPGPALWASKDADIPINVMDVAPMAGPDGRMYQQVSDPKTGAPLFVPLDEIVQTTPVAEPAPVAYDPMSGAIPGVETGAAGQVIPAPVPPAPRFTQEGAAVDPDVASAIAAQEEQDKVAAQDAITAWYETNAAPEVKAARARIVIDTAEPAVMPAVDMQAVAGLLRRAPKVRDNGYISPERAAFVYFSKSPDTNYVLESIAYDQAQLMSPKLDAYGRKYKREADFRRATEFESADEAAFYAGTGAEVARRAARWIRDNLSEGTRAQVADYTFNKYRPIDYEAAAESRDVRQAQNRNRKAEVDQIVRETYGDGTIDAEAAADLGFGTEDLGGYDLSSFAGQTEWASNVHPRVAQLIRAGNFRGALQGLAITAPSTHLRGLAQKLLARIGTTPVQVVSPDVMNSIRAQLSPETPTLGVETPAGVYVHPRNEAQIAAMRREGHDVAADLIEQYGGQILFNENTALAPELVLHEAVHAVADATLTNLSHVLTRQLDKLRTNLLKFMPANEYGLSNVRELLAEGLNNPVFRRNMSSVNTEGKPYSAWQEFKHIMRNFLRTLMGQPTVKPDSALTTLDRVLNAVLASNPNEIDAGNIVGASFAPGGLRDQIVDATKRMRVPTKADLIETRAIMEDVTIDPKWRDMFAAFLQPLNFAARAASKYLPSAEAVVDAVRQHRAAQNASAENVARDIRPIADAIKINARDPEALKNMEIVRLIGSAEEVNVVTNTEADYKGYSYRYNVLDAGGTIVDTVESKRYNTETERNVALQRYNASLAPDAPKRARARRSFDEDAAQLDIFRRLKPRFDGLKPELKKALVRAYALPEKQRKGLDAAIRANLEALAPQNKTLQNKIFGTFYAKIAADNLINPYQNLTRSGNYWISYTAYDPIVGQARLNKHSFPSLAAQQTAYRMLSTQNDRYYAAVQQAMNDPRPLEEFRIAAQGVPANPAAGTPAIKPTLIIPAAISDRITEGTPDQPGIIPAFGLHPYQETAKTNVRQRPPLEFVAKLFDAIDGSSELAGLIDPNTGKAADAKEKILEMFFDASPETSFMQVFRKRAGRRGFENDFTLLRQDITAGDVISNMSAANLRLARNIVDLEYGAKFAGLRKQLEAEYGLMKNAPPPGVSPRSWMRQQDAALRYMNALTGWTRVPFQTRGQASRSAVAVTYMATLGLNPSTAMLSTMSLPMVFAPYVGPIYGYRNTVKAVGIASKMLGGSGRVRRVERMGLDGNLEIIDEKRPIYDYSFDNRDYTQPENAFLRAAHRVWKTNGMMHSTLTYDELLGETPNIAQKAAGVAGILQHAAEQYTRETSLFASFALDLQKRMGMEGQPIDKFVADLQAGRLVASEADATAAAKESITLTELVNGSAAAAMGARMSQSDLGYVIYLFKRHPLAMLNLLWETANRSFGPTTEDSTLARKQIAGMAGMLVGVSGLMGLPMSQQVLMLYDWLWADDDEPDGETALRIAVGEVGAYGILDWLLGTKVSSRLGYGGAIYRTAFGSEDMPPIHQVIEGFGGPVFGLLAKYTSGRARELFADGEYVLAAEATLPTSIANVVRAYRFMTEGVENRNGNPLLEDVGPYSIAAQFLGFMPTSYAQVLAKNSLGTRIDNAIRTKRTDLLRKLILAENAGDRAREREVRDEILAFNRRHPRATIDDAVIDRSRTSREALNARTNHGLAVSPQNLRYIQSILDDIGPATIGG